jgi:DDE superfamily endonuclease/Winged helix-turn helix
VDPGDRPAADPPTVPGGADRGQRRRTLHDLGFSAQRPLYRAEQADPAALARWKAVEYPKIAAEARAVGGTVSFVDEAGVRSDDHAGTTWAPVAKTPAVRTTGARFARTMISAISAQGALRFAVFTGSFTAAGVIAFLYRLLHDAGQRGSGPVFCIVDGHPVHRATAVDDFVQSTDGALRLYRLPAYSPQLNLDEWVWNNVKHDGMAAAAPKGAEQMTAAVTARLRRLQRLPHIVRGFFADPELAYVTAVA